MTEAWRILGSVGENHLYECHTCFAVVNDVIRHGKQHEPAVSASASPASADGRPQTTDPSKLTHRDYPGSHIAPCDGPNGTCFQTTCRCECHVWLRIEQSPVPRFIGYEDEADTTEGPDIQHGHPHVNAAEVTSHAHAGGDKPHVHSKSETERGGTKGVGRSSLDSKPSDPRYDRPCPGCGVRIGSHGPVDSARCLAKLGLEDSVTRKGGYQGSAGPVPKRFDGPAAGFNPLSTGTEPEYAELASPTGPEGDPVRPAEGQGTEALSAADIEAFRDLLRYLGCGVNGKESMGYQKYRDVWDAGRAALTKVERGARLADGPSSDRYPTLRATRGVQSGDLCVGRTRMSLFGPVKATDSATPGREGE